MMTAFLRYQAPFRFRCEDWAKRIFRADLLGRKNEAKWKNACVCSQHFADNMYMCPSQRHEATTRLIWTAHPTMNLYKETQKPSLRRPPRSRTQLERPRVEKVQARSDTQILEDTSLSISATTRCGRKPTPPVAMIRKLKAEQRENANLKRKLKLLEARFSTLKAEAAQLKRWRQQCNCSKLASLRSPVRDFIKDITVNFSKRRPTWSLASLRIATGLLHFSPRCHRFLGDMGIPLPCRSTIRRSLGQCMRSSGICPTIEATITSATESMTSAEKACTVSLDGMSIRPSLRFNPASDRIVGFEDCGSEAGGRTPQIADELIVVWLRGVCSKWKQPIGYYCVNHSPGAKRFQQILTEAAAAVQRQ